LFNEKFTPALRFANFSLIIPGDADNSLFDKKLIPFFKSFNKIEKLNFTISFLSEENEVNQKKRLLSELNYPFLNTFEAIHQKLRTEDLEPFLKRHAGTLRILNLRGNFLEKGFFELLAKLKLILTALAVTRTSFTV
jgi:hypothetical protein